MFADDKCAFFRDNMPMKPTKQTPIYQDALAYLEAARSKGLSFNMARGKPSPEQLDLAAPLLETLHASSDFIDAQGQDVRNYGSLTGIPEARALFAGLLGVGQDNVIIYGNSSLHAMYEQISRSMTHGVLGEKPWSQLAEVKWLCPVPGYDRHFAILEYFGIKMINVPLLEDGPDMDFVEKAIEDPTVKGIWCVPHYSNPTGITYSDAVVKRLAALSPKAKDFRIYWDNAYAIHHLYKEGRGELLNIYDEAKKLGNEDILYLFVSTSKISFPGAGVAAFACSTANLEQVKRQMGISTIGYDKINQLRHVKYFGSLDGLQAHIDRLADILRPKFELVDRILTENLSGIDGVRWTKPRGGYFISLEVEGKAKEVVSKCKQCGVILTPAGATYPYGKDPNNSNIRIAPTYPSLQELELACRILCAAIIVEMAEG